MGVNLSERKHTHVQSHTQTHKNSTYVEYIHDRHIPTRKTSYYGYLDLLVVTKSIIIDFAMINVQSLARLCTVNGKLSKKEFSLKLRKTPEQCHRQTETLQPRGAIWIYRVYFL